MNDQDNHFEHEPNPNFTPQPPRDFGNGPDQGFTDHPSGDFDEPSKGGAFAKGGCGCLLAFLVLAFFAVLIGGSVHIDILGAIFLFVVGGVIGLIFLAVYNKGRQDGS